MIYGDKAHKKMKAWLSDYATVDPTGETAGIDWRRVAITRTSKGGPFAGHATLALRSEVAAEPQGRAVNCASGLTRYYKQSYHPALWGLREMLTHARSIAPSGTANNSSERRR